MICIGCSKELLENEGSSAHGFHRECFCHEFQLASFEDFQELIPQQVTSLEPTHPADVICSSFFHGKFKKYSAILGGTHYILKIQEQEAPELPAVEFVSNKLAKEFGLRIPPFHFLNLYGETPAFLSKNFIANPAIPATLVHIYHFLNVDERFSCENILNILRNQGCGFSEIEFFVHMCLFDAVIGNHDRHGRNLGIIETPRQKTLAPAYDNPSFLGIHSGNLLKAQFEPRGRIATESTAEPTVVDYCVEFERLDLGLSIKVFHKKVMTVDFKTIINTGPCSELMKAAFCRLVEKRVKEFDEYIYNR